MRKFGRCARVTLVRQPPPGSFGATNPGYFEGNAELLEISSGPGPDMGCRIAFEVTKNLGKEPNKAKIKIYNLNEFDRGAFKTKPARCSLYAGFDGEFGLLFVGDVHNAESSKDGPDWITEVQVSDGLRAYSHGRMNRSYKPPIPVIRVLQDCAKSLGLTLPRELDQSEELRNALDNGISAHGPTRDVLTRLLAAYGFSWSVQDGHLVVLRDEDTREGTAILVNEDDAGMLGSPHKTTPESPGGKAEITFEMLLERSVGPGRLAYVQSQAFNEACKITDVTHEGDTDEGDFKTTAKGKPVQAKVNL